MCWDGDYPPTEEILVSALLSSNFPPRRRPSVGMFQKPGALEFSFKFDSNLVCDSWVKPYNAHFPPIKWGNVDALDNGNQGNLLLPVLTVRRCVGPESLSAVRPTSPHGWCRVSGDTRGTCFLLSTDSGQLFSKIRLLMKSS